MILATTTLAWLKIPTEHGINSFQEAVLKIRKRSRDKA